MHKELASLFEKLSIEYSKIDEKANLFMRAGRMGSYPEKGKGRYGTEGYSAQSATSFNNSVLNQLVRHQILALPTTRKIFDYVSQHKLWIKEGQSYEEDAVSGPSITSNIIAGFLTRNFEINNYQFVVTNVSFLQAFSELLAFFQNDEIDIIAYLSLYGPSGDVEKITLTENICVEKANYDIVKLFNIFYTDNSSHHIDMFDGDYVLVFRYSVPKSDHQKVFTFEESLMEKWFHFCLLCEIGNVEFGKKLLVSSGWPLLTLKAPSSILYNVNHYSAFFKSNYFFKASEISRYHELAEIIERTDFRKIDAKIKYSIERLQKSKASRNINDRIVELSLALEYLINTTNSEVTLQLCLKAIILLNDNNIDSEIFKKLKKFYDFRSKIVHGNSKIEINSINADIINFTETTIQKLIVTVIQINQRYNYTVMNEALTIAMHVRKPLMEILEEQNSKKKN